MKIKISYLWLLFLPVFYFSRLYKVLWFLFLLMSIHESMHMLCALFLGYRIDKVCIYPFGLCASIADFEYKHSLREILVLISGLSVHIIAAFFLPCLYHLNLLSFPFLQYIQKSNIALLWFNALPIYPLDGGRILKCVLEYVFPYKKAKSFTFMISIMSAFICFLVLPFTKAQFYLYVCLFLIEYLFLLYRYKEDIRLFYLYRYLHPCCFPLKIHTCLDIYKNRFNYIVLNGEIKDEKEVLQEWI